MAVSASAAYAAARKQQQQPPPPPQPSLSQPLQTLSTNESLSSRSNTSGGGAFLMANAAPGMSHSAHGQRRRPSPDSCTPTALSRWSLLNSKLPAVDSIRHLHVYDFDNTLFKTPLPNQKLWSTTTVGFLSSQDTIAGGGWWHDVRILSATGDGLAQEEPRAWDGWWNEQVVELVRLSSQQPDALTVLLTGRAEAGFGGLIQRIVSSKGLKFDMVVLKPAVGPNNEQFSSTMVFKQVFLEALMETYSAAAEIRIYEDRPRHVQGFRDFLEEYNSAKKEAERVATSATVNDDSGGSKKENINENNEGTDGNGTAGRSETTGHQQKRLGPISGEVVHVTDVSTTLDPVVEVAEVQHMVNCHNALSDAGKTGSSGRALRRLAINKTVFFTAYLIKEADTKRLLSLMQIDFRRDVRQHANAILISTYACSPHIMNKVGGLGSKMSWEVVATGSADNNVWAASLRAVPSTASYHVDGSHPVVVLAVARPARPHDARRISRWQPVPHDKAFVFETTVGEKALLRVEFEANAEGSSSGDHPHTGVPAKRKHSGLHQNHYGQSIQGNSNIPTQPASFGAPRAGLFGSQGRGYYSQATARGGRGGLGGGGAFRGQGHAGSRGGHRGNASARARGGGRGGIGSGGGGGGGGGLPVTSKPPGRHHFYQSLDDTGSGGGTGASASTQLIVYDDDAMQ